MVPFILAFLLSCVVYAGCRNGWSRHLRERISDALSTFADLQARDGYVCGSLYSEWKNSHQRIRPSLNLCDFLVWVLSPGAWKLRRLLRSALSAVTRRNEEHVARELLRNKEWFDTVESYPLTSRQRAAVLHDENNCLVIAGAGTGKTSTVIAKACYILRKGLAEPQQILLMAFNNSAKNEILDRMNAKLNTSAVVRTFHGLGLEIIAKSKGKKPSVSVLTDDYQLLVFIEKILNELLEEETKGQRIVRFLACYLYPYKPMGDFASLNDYWAYLRSHGVVSLKSSCLRTAKKEQVKSFGELQIANWLLLNGVRYEYEADYAFDTATVSRRQYAPDFFLPDYMIYIEHFGVDRFGSTAPFVDREDYARDMEWKRRTHRDYGTQLVETYSYERAEGVLLRNLERKLREKGVLIKPMSVEEVRKILSKSDSITNLTKLVCTFLRLFKSGQYSLHDIYGAAEIHSDPSRCNAFCDVFAEVLERYQDELRRQKKVDFDDMIQQATELVRAGEYIPDFKYFIVDEFQDISRGRAKFLKALVERVQHRRLFCVGDDWQSIYRFTGSDIAIMRGFDLLFGDCWKTELDTTFRFDTNLLGLSSAFILRNKSQIPKKLSSHSNVPGEIVQVSWEPLETDGATAVKSVLHEIDRQSSNQNSTVLLLGRYRHSQPKGLHVLSRKYRNLRIEFSTVHKAKGLEADYVVILNLVSGRMGFPCEIADDPLLEMALPKKERYPNAEERRVFYVALTRARKRAYLISDPRQMSSFVAELRDESYEGLVEFEGSSFSRDACPTCGGDVVRRLGSFGKFWSCSNSPRCKRKFPTCAECRAGALMWDADSFRCNFLICGTRSMRCPSCGEGALVKRSGPYGAFMGCTKYRWEGPSCGYKRRL